MVELTLRRRITCSASYKTSALRASIVKYLTIHIRKRWPYQCLLWSRSVTLWTGKRRPPHREGFDGGLALASFPATRAQMSKQAIFKCNTYDLGFATHPDSKR